MITVAMARRAALAYRQAGEPARAVMALTNEIGVWRREGRPISERLTAIEELWTELEGLPDTPDVLEARALICFLLAITHLDAGAMPLVRIELDRMADLGDRLGDPEWRAMAEWKNGLADVKEGDVQGGLARVGAVAHAAARVGWEGTGVTAFREASMVAAAAMDYAAASDFIREGVRYSDSIEQSHCAHVMRATLAMVSWAGARPREAEDRARQAISDRGCRLGIMTAQMGPGLHDHVTRGARGCDGRPDRRARVRNAERADRAHPAAAVGPGRGRPPGRRSEAAHRISAATPWPARSRSTNACC